MTNKPLDNETLWGDPDAGGDGSQYLSQDEIDDLENEILVENLRKITEIEETLGIEENADS